MSEKRIIGIICIIVPIIISEILLWFLSHGWKPEPFWQFNLMILAPGLIIFFIFSVVSTVFYWKDWS